MIKKCMNMMKKVHMFFVSKGMEFAVFSNLILNTVQNLKHKLY